MYASARIFIRYLSDAGFELEVTVLVAKFWADDQGQDIAEYAVMLAVSWYLWSAQSGSWVPTPITCFLRQPVRFNSRNRSDYL
jgi:hypothetical protein